MEDDSPDTLDNEPSEEELATFLKRINEFEVRYPTTFSNHYVSTHLFMKKASWAQALEAELYALRKSIANDGGKLDENGFAYLRAVTKHFAAAYPEAFHRDYVERADFELERNQRSLANSAADDFRAFKESLRRRIRCARNYIEGNTVPLEFRRTIVRTLQEVADDTFGGHRSPRPHDAFAVRQEEEPMEG